MSSTVYANGTATIAVPASQSIAVYTVGDNAASVYQDVGYPNIPESWRLIGTVQNVQTIYGPFTNAASVRIDAGANAVQYNVGATPAVSVPVTDITSAVAVLDITGLADAQGGTINVTGGASSTSANAGGPVVTTGGAAGATGIGGAVTHAGAAGGATSGAGGQANNIGGAGTAGNSAGGIANNRGGAGQGSAAGGKAQNIGGIGGVTGAGGAAENTGGAGGATSGLGGDATNRGGAGTAGNSAGGAAGNIGGAGQGSAAGGVANNTGGLGGGTGIGGAANNIGGAGGATSGKGGVASNIGGAATNGNTDGGAGIIAGGAKAGSGFIGPVILGNAQLMPIWSPQAAPMADGGDTPFTVTIAQLIAGLISMTPTTGRAITTPTGAEMDAGVAFADVPATFGFDFTVQNRAAFAATDDIITLTAGASGVTITGTATVAPGVAGRFRAVRTTTATWIIYKIAG